MFTDEQLTKITYQVDDFLIKQITDHQISPLNLSGVLLARMIRLNQDAETETDLYKLFQAILNKEHEQPEQDKVIH